MSRSYVMLKCASIVLSAALALGGCASQSRSAGENPNGPADSHAMESKPTARSQTLAHDHGGHGEAMPAAFKCPMHPDQTSDHPAACPKCGMKMVPAGPTTAPTTGPATKPADPHAGHAGHGGK